MKKRIKIYFVDFWPVFNKQDNFFLDFLKEDYEVVLDKENPDFLFYSVFGTEHYGYNCVKIFFTGENIRPNFQECDWALTFDYSENPRNYRLPLYAFYEDVNKLTLPKPPIDELFKEKTKFCNFIYSNPSCKKRNEFFKKLSKYKKVDSAGRLYRNTSERIGDKIQFIRQYKFTFAFENESYPGYTTEKIFEPMISNSIPIYWGNPLVNRDFNEKSFLNYHQYGSDEELIKKIIELDNNDDLYKQMLAEPYFNDNKVNEFVNRDNIKNRLKQIIESDISPISANHPRYYYSGISKEIRANYLSAKFAINHNYKKIKTISPLKIKIKIEKMRGK